VQPDFVTFVGVLTACPNMVAIEEGRCVYWDIIESGLESDDFVGSSLVNMYAKVWEHGGCLESDKKDAIPNCGHLECHTWRMCHERAW